MKLLTAKEARELRKKVSEEELNKVLEEIRQIATKGEEKLFIYRKLKNETLEALNSLGFEVSNYGAVAIQRDRLYYKITWN